MANNNIPQLATFRMKVGQNLPTDDAQDIVGRVPFMVDRLQARIIVEPSGLGATPTQDQVAAIERLLRFRLALDRNDRRVVTVGDISTATLQQLNGGPVAVPPFKLNPGEQPKVKWNIPANAFQSQVFQNFGPVWLEIVFWGQEA